MKRVRIDLRLNRNITRSPYGVKTVYKKGTLIQSLSESQFQKITEKNIYDFTMLSICEGHGVYEYFDLRDIDCFKVTTRTVKTVKKIKFRK